LCLKPPPLTILTGLAVKLDENLHGASKMLPFLYSLLNSALLALRENLATKNLKQKHKDLTLKDNNNDGDNDFHLVKNLNLHVVNGPKNIFDKNRDKIEIETKKGARIIYDMKSF
jgi:hypothetical protein